eukprot:1152494-Pelagomonas_calceolata.AAC.2
MQRLRTSQFPAVLVYSSPSRIRLPVAALVITICSPMRCSFPGSTKQQTGPEGVLISTKVQEAYGRASWGCCAPPWQAQASMWEKDLPCAYHNKGAYRAPVSPLTSIRIKE